MANSQGPWVVAVRRVGKLLAGLLPASEAIVFDEAAFTVTHEPDAITAAADGAEVRGRTVIGLQSGLGAVVSVGAVAPIASSGGPTPVISISPATTGAAGSMSAADKTKLDGITDGAAVANVVGAAPIVVTGTTTKTVSINNASSSTAGAMTIALYNFVTNLFTASTPTTIVPNAAADTGSQPFAAHTDHTHGIATAAPVAVGSANAEGSGDAFARASHVHDHGAHTSPTDHALATASAHGFESASDKAANPDPFTVQTSGSGATSAGSVALADNTVYFLEADVIARDTAGTHRAYYKRAIRAHRQGGGGATLGSVASLVTDETNASINFAFGTSGNDVTLDCTGLAATTFNWSVTLRMRSVS